MKKVNLKRFAGSLAALILIPLFLSSCYPDYGMSTSDYDIIVTRYDKDVNFKSFKTYAMPDSVFHIFPKDEDDTINRDYDKEVIARVKDNMDKLGYEHDVPADSDHVTKETVVVIISATNSTYQGYSYYPGWGYPGWGWGYPGWGYYPGWAVPYQYSTGTIIVEMYDGSRFDEETEIAPIIWVGGINGLTSGSSPSSIKSRIISSIDQAFNQSPYLKIN
jgi:hypothetical protein